MKIILFLLLAFATLIQTGCSNGASEKPTSSKTEVQADIAVIVSPFLKNKSDSVKTLAFWGFRQGGTNITWFDGFNASEITRFTVPRLNYYSDEAAAQRIGLPAQIIEDWSRGSVDGTLHPSALSIANTFSRVPQNLQRAPEMLIIVGSPVGRDWGTRYPALGQLNHPDSEFSSLGRETSLQGTRVFWQFPLETSLGWPARFEERLREFYSVLCQSRGASLVYFGPDLSAMLAAASRPVPAGAAPANWRTNTPSLAMLDAIPKPDVQESARKVDPPITLTNAGPIKLATSTQPPPSAATTIPVSVAARSAPTKQPPSISATPLNSQQPVPRNSFVGNAPSGVTSRPAEPQPTPLLMSRAPRPTTAVPRPQAGVTLAIAYRSKTAVADLFLRPEKRSREISARTNHRETDRGAYSEGYDAQTGESIKWVWLPAGLDRAKAELFINYSSGDGELSGRIMWLSPTGDAEMPFAFHVTSGRPGKTRSGPWWVWNNLTNLKDQTFAQTSRNP